MHLKELYQDKELLDELKNYFQTFIDLKTLELTYDRKDTTHLADAKDLLDGAFEQLSTDFDPKPKTKTIEELNNAI